MARKSRKENAKATTLKLSTAQTYRTGIYVRLSREDERKIESNSIENQIAFLKDFIRKSTDLDFSDVYVDNSFTGTSFDRPGFRRMMEDVRNGKITCIVVKDLSRLGRNYLEAGNYIESIFPFFGVRFIAVTDQYDSLRASPSEDGLTVPLKNLINEAYAKDISKKICTSFENQFKQGIFLATTAAYGYIKDPHDSHMVLVDEDVKDIVIRVFNEYINGKSLAGIARSLNIDGIPAPSVYWQKKDIIHKQKYSSVWEGKQIRRILQNPIYTGDVLISKTQKCYYKGITSPVKRNDGYYVKDHHEAIIDHDTFQQAQQRLKERRESYFSTRNERRTGNGYFKENIFRGILYCGDCGKKMYLYHKTVKLVNSVGHYNTYICRRSSTNGLNDPPKNVKAEDLETMVLDLIRQHIAVYEDTKHIIHVLNRKPDAINKKYELEAELAKLENQRDRTINYINNLRDDYNSQLFSEKEYLELKAGYLSELDTIDSRVEEVRNRIETYSETYCGSNELADVFQKYAGVTELSREVVLAFIRKITCFSKTSFEVEYTFDDELQRLMKLAEEREMIT